MPNRFEGAVTQDLDLLDKVIQQGFPELQIARFLIYMDTKKRKSKGKYIIARIKKNNEEMRIATMDDSGLEYHYSIFLDNYVWQNLDEKDQIRTLRRLLAQCDIDHDNTNDPYKMKDFEVQDFYSEIEFNKDDNRWLERVNLTAESLYDDEEEEAE